MNILHYSGMPETTKFGGLERWFATFAFVARGMGHNVYLSYTETCPTQPDIIDPYIESGLTVLLTRDNQELLDVIGRHKIEIVFCHFAEPYNEPVFIKKHTKCKVYSFFHCHNYYSTLSWRENFRELLCATVYRWNIFKSQFLIDGFFAVSKAVRRQFIKFCGLLPNKVHLYYLGTEVKKYTKNNQCNIRPIVCCVAGHGDYKGLDVLIEAVKVLKNEGLNFEVWQVGGGMYLNKGMDTIALKKLATRSGIDDVLFWLGIRNDVHDILSQCDIYVQPSRREAISLTVAEAMMHELPVVASNVDGIPEYIKHGENGLLYKNNDPRKLAALLKRLIQSKAECERIGKAAYTSITAGKFNMVDNIKKLIKATC